MQSLYERLKEYAADDFFRMHMPGHKGNPAAAPWMNTDAALDITEISGFDNLHCPEGILKNSMERASKLWHSRQSFYLVNGSTCGILAGIRALTKRGDKVICARNCHMSVFHAIELCGLQPCFFTPPAIEDIISVSADADSVRQIIRHNPDAKLVIITSPTYEGIISDIRAICTIAHENNMAVLVDGAHDAHLDLSPFFAGGAVSGGADITVQSLHKTLPCPTQTAILHVCGDTVDIDRLKHQLTVFETSSPSYLFLAAIDGFVGSDVLGAMSAWDAALDDFYERVSTEKLLLTRQLFGSNPLVFNFDKSKIVISTENANLDGCELGKLLREKYHTETELACPSHVIAMTGCGDTTEKLSRFAEFITEIDRELCFDEKEKPGFFFQCPSLELLPEEALERKHEFVHIKNSAGKISGEYVWAYPPGIPLIIPGERITEEFAETILKTRWGSVHSTRGRIPKEIAVIS